MGISTNLFIGICSKITRDQVKNLSHNNKKTQAFDLGYNDFWFWGNYLSKLFHI